MAAGLVAPQRMIRVGCLVSWTLFIAAWLSFGAQLARADPAGHITEFSQGLNSGSQPRGIVAAADGALWFADAGTIPAIGRADTAGNIREYDLPAGSQPRDVAAAFGYVWFTDAGKKAIGRINPSTGHVDDYTGAALTSTSAPTGIAAGPDGKLWFTDRGSVKAIDWLDPKTGAIGQNSFLPTGSDPRGIAQGPDGNMWFADSGTHSIGRFSPTFPQVHEFSSGLQTDSAPIWIAPGPDGELFFTDQSGSGALLGQIFPSAGPLIFEYGAPFGMNPSGQPLGIAAGPDGNIWFTDFKPSAPAIDRVVYTGGTSLTIHAYPLAPGSLPVGIWPGQDGNMWVADGAGKIGRVGTGASSALQAPPVVAGSHRAGDPQTCEPGQWSTWAGVSPMNLGYSWLRSDAAIAGQTSQTYTPTPTDVGKSLVCQDSVDYGLPLLVPVPAMSTAFTVQPPRLSSLQVLPRRLALAGRRVHGRCLKRTRKNRRRAHCRRSPTLRISFKLGAASSVAFRLERVVSGRRVKGRCVKPRRKNRKHKKCKRSAVVLRFARSATAGSNQVTLKRRLGPGSYELTATPSANSLTDGSETTKFTVVS